MEHVQHLLITLVSSHSIVMQAFALVLSEQLGWLQTQPVYEIKIFVDVCFKIYLISKKKTKCSFIYFSLTHTHIYKRSFFLFAIRKNQK